MRWSKKRNATLFKGSSVLLRGGGEVTYSPSHMILSSFPLYAAPIEPLLCKFADGGQKKRQSQSKYPQNGRPWHRDGEVRRDISAF